LVQSPAKEEAQGRCSLLDRMGSQLSILEQVQLKVTDLLGSELIGRTLEMSRPLANG
jgi:hypothetical protein